VTKRGALHSTDDLRLQAPRNRLPLRAIRIRDDRPLNWSPIIRVSSLRRLPSARRTPGT